MEDLCRIGRIYRLSTDSVLATTGHREEPVAVFPAQWQRRPSGWVLLEAGSEVEMVRLDPILQAAEGDPNATALFICRGRPELRTELFSALLTAEPASRNGTGPRFGVISPWLDPVRGAPEWNAARFDEIAAERRRVLPGSRLESVVMRPAA